MLDKLNTTDFVVCVVVLAALLGISAYRSPSLKLPLPPGPPGKLFYGNAHQLPKVAAWLTYAKWAEKYGPIFYFRNYRQEFIVLNSAKSVADLLESRSAIYSDRPIIWMGQVLIGRQLSVFNISSFHPRFKIYRKELQSGLSGRAIQTYLPVIADEIPVFLSSLSSSPENFISHIRRTSGAIILKIAYGWTVKDNDDYFVKLINDVFRLSSSVLGPGKYLVDVFPWLRFVPAWVPGAGFKRKAASIRQTMERLDRIPYQWAKEQIQSGEYVESYMSKVLCSEDDKTFNQEEEDILNCCSQAFYIGGADTTVSAMTTFFLMMTLHPQVQRRAQAEIERVVGQDRLANINDQKDLPYVVAVIKEVLRWAAIVPQGLPHRVTQDDTYQGFRIPKGTIIIANIWAITRDSEMYPNPEIFDPERFLPRPGVEAQADPRKFIFGFGRRVCPGALFAETSIFLNATAVLATFNISKAINAEGQEIEPTVGFIPETIVTHVKPFDCRITPRAPDLLAALNAA